MSQLVAVVLSEFLKILSVKLYIMLPLAQQNANIVCCRCPDTAAAAAAAANFAISELESPSSVSATYYSLSSLAALHSAGAFKQAVSAKAVARVVALFKDLVDSQGRFKDSKAADARRSITATGRAYMALAAARSLGVELDEDDIIAVDDLTSGVGKVRLCLCLVTASRREDAWGTILQQHVPAVH